MAGCNVQATKNALSYFFGDFNAHPDNRLVIDVQGGERFLKVVRVKEIPFLDRMIAYLFGAGPAAFHNVVQLCMDCNVSHTKLAAKVTRYNEKHFSYKKVDDAFFSMDLQLSTLAASKIPLTPFEEGFEKRHPDGSTILIRAVRSGKMVEVGSALALIPMEKNAALEYVDNQNYTALMYAVVKKDVDVVDLLLRAGAKREKALPLAKDDKNILMLLLKQ